MSSVAITLTKRDHALIRATWSLGLVSATVLRDVISPATSVKTLSGRLSELTAAGFLRRTRVVGGPAGHLWLYGVGRRGAAADPGFARPWRPPEFHLPHTLEVAETLAALVTPGRLGRLHVTEWQGQAELRAWHRPGEAMADLYVRWSTDDAAGGWHVEVDRGTESRHALRRKLFRYLHTPDRVALVVTTSDERARNIARLARELGARVLTTDRRTLRSGAPVLVYDVIKGCRRPVDDLAS